MKKFLFLTLFVLILSACTDSGTSTASVVASSTEAEPVVISSEPAMVSDPALLIMDKEPENIEEYRVWMRCGKDKRLGLYFGAHFLRVKVNDADKDIILYPEPTAANSNAVYIAEDKHKLIIKNNADRVEWTEPQKVAEICEKEQIAVSDAASK